MSGWFDGWPPGAVEAIVVSGLAALAWPIKKAFNLWGKRSDVAEDIHKRGWEEARYQSSRADAMVRLVDRGRRRENTLTTSCELLLIAMPPVLTHEQKQIVDRASELFEATLLHLDGDEGFG